MKLSKNYVIKELMGSYVLVPLGDTAIDFNGVVTLNETAKFLWETATGEFDETLLCDALQKEYKVDLETAKTAVQIFIDRMKEEGCIEE